MKRIDNFSRLLFIGDNHCDNITPGSRSDDYMAATIDELQESLEIGRDRQCGAVILLGDVFHRIEVGGDCRNAVLRTLKTGNNGGAWPFPIYTVVGNHDIKHNIQNLPHSALGTLIEAGAVIYVDEALEIGVRFGHFRNSLVNELKAGLIERHTAPIWAIHASITIMPYFGEHVIFDALPTNSNTKMVIAGHVHFPMEQLRDDGVWFINPGNVGRERATQENMGRQPQVLLLEHDGQFQNFKREYIELTRSLPAQDIFKVDEIRQRKDEEIDTKDYILKVSQIGLWSGTEDKYESLRISGQMKQVDSTIVELAIQTVEHVNDQRMKKQSAI